MENLIDNILELLKIKSISGNKTEIRRVLDLVKEKLAPVGAFIREYNYEGADPVLLLSNTEDNDFDIMTIGHLDVVPAKDELFVPKIENGRIYARGALDMKSCVAVNIEALNYAMHKNLKFAVLITTDEETTSNGVKALVKHENIRAKLILDPDAGNLYTMCDKAKHPVSAKIKAFGENAHSSRPWEGINAISRLSNCIKDLEQDFGQYEKDGPQPENIWVDTMVVTAFNSPTTYNVIPASAEALVSFRLTEKITLPQLENRLKIATKKYGCDYEIALSSRGVYMDADNSWIAAYKKIAQATTGHTIRMSQMCGGTDARMFSDHSIIIMHSINGENPHGDMEYAEIDSIHTLLDIEKQFIDEYLKKEGQL